MSKQDEQQARVLVPVGAGLLGIAEVAVLIMVGERQVQRLRALRAFCAQPTFTASRIEG